MDHEKLQAVVPQVFEYDGPSSTTSPEPLNIRAPSIDEPEYVEDRRERRGESVW
jgi:amino acid transporter